MTARKSSTLTADTISVDKVTREETREGGDGRIRSAQVTLWVVVDRAFIRLLGEYPTRREAMERARWARAIRAQHGATVELAMTAIETVVGGLSDPSKMPGKAFGFSPEQCITGSKLRLIPGSVCSDCYACKGCYQFPTVTAAHMRRFASLRAALNDTLGHGLDWAHAMVTLIGRQRVPYFRWHDAGDLQSVEHLQLIAAIARRTPQIRHWLPTREYRMVKEYLSREPCPENLVIRLSAHMRNETIPVVQPGCVASAVYDDRTGVPGHHCPASKQGGECGDCRACWSLDVPLVVYPTH